MDNDNGILAFYSLEFMYILEWTNSPSYNRLMWEHPFAFVFYMFFTDKWFNPPWGWYLFSNLGSYKVLDTYVFCLYICNFWNFEWLPRVLISNCFKMLLFGVSKVGNRYSSPWLKYLFVSALYWILFWRLLVR